MGCRCRGSCSPVPLYFLNKAIRLRRRECSKPKRKGVCMEHGKKYARIVLPEAPRPQAISSKASTAPASRVASARSCVWQTGCVPSLNLVQSRIKSILPGTKPSYNVFYEEERKDHPHLACRVRQILRGGKPGVCRH